MRRALDTWSRLGPIEKFALIQGQLLLWAVVVVGTYLMATKLGVGVAVVYVTLLAATFARTVRDVRRRKRNGEYGGANGASGR